MTTRAKRKVTEISKYCSLDLNGMNTELNFNILPLGSYNVLVGMDWL